jgi:hypothetical protein
MNRRSCRSAPWLVMAIALPLFSQSAKATAQDVLFACGTGAPAVACSGTVVPVGSNASTTGVVVKNTQGPDFLKNFTLKFNTAALTTSLKEIGGDGSLLTGVITSFNVFDPPSGTGEVFLNVTFNLMPSEFASFLGGGQIHPGTVDAHFRVSTGLVTNSFTDISATPEPASYLLMGTGMLLCAMVLRRIKSTRQSTLAA